MADILKEFVELIELKKQKLCIWRMCSSEAIVCMSIESVIHAHNNKTIERQDLSLNTVEGVDPFLIHQRNILKITAQ